MKLLEVYKEKNKKKTWFNKYFSSGKNSFGRMFGYTSTNFRNQGTFISDFSKFLEIENKPRNDWPKQTSHGQEIHKQYVINMLQSKLFRRGTKNGLFSRTSKGVLYTAFINLEMPESDKWFINYLFLLNGYFLNRKNYILSRVKEDLLNSFLIIDEITKDLLITEAKKILEKTSFEEIIRSDFFYFHSFYNDSDFLICYLRATIEEKEELALYIETNRKTKNYQCCISKKYKPGSTFNTKSLLDETKVFLLTLLFIEEKTVDLTNICEIFFDNFNKNISLLNKKISLNYIKTNRAIFDPIFEEILELETITALDAISVDDVVRMDKLDSRDVPEEYIDETNEIGKQRIKAIFNSRKKQARMLGGYKCALELINNCCPIYFTSKTTKQNYLELHHFIPQEFRNDFSYSIEVLANYITLCPRCHKQIHLATDRERKHLINALYNNRNPRLKVVGLNVDLKEIYKYYRVS